MKLSGLLLVCLIAAFTTIPAFATSDDGIDGFLRASASSWNGGDFDGFMRGYENAPTTLYISSKTIIRGYAAIRARYAAHYGTRNLGVLSFSDVTKRMLGTEYAVVIAHWHPRDADREPSDRHLLARPTSLANRLAYHRRPHALSGIRRPSRCRRSAPFSRVPSGTPPSRRSR